MRFDCGHFSHVFGGIVLGCDHETSSLACTPVHRLYDVNEFLLVCHGPVDLVIVTRPKIDHDVLVSEEKHNRARIVQLVHRVEIRHLRNVDKVAARRNRSIVVSVFVVSLELITEYVYLTVSNNLSTS